jgi:CSLREA domain-containing protein
MRIARPAGLAVVVVLLVSQPASADIITPNTLTDEYNANASTCSLREAVQASNTDMVFDGCPTGNGADEIQLGNGTYQLSRADTGSGNDNGDLQVTSGDTLTISHAGAGRTAIDAGDLDRVIHNVGTLTITGLAIQNGRVTSDLGGGIANEGGLTMTNAAVTDNEILSSGYGGGIWSQPGPLTLTNVTVSGNQTSASGLGAAGLFVGPGASLTNVTITANTAAGGTSGGLSQGVGTVTLKNTIIAGNAAPSSPDCDGAPGFGRVISSQGYNLIGNTSGCTFTAGTGDQFNVPAGLGSLADNGGPTSTHALVVGSNAVDQIPPASCGGLTADQRGFPRPSANHANCDVGAYELTTCDGVPLNTPGAFLGCPPLRPVLTGTDPPSGADNNNPRVIGTAEAGSTVSLYDNATCTPPAAFTGPAAFFASPGFVVTVPDNSTTTFSATATSGAGTSLCSTVNVTYTEVTPPPPAGGAVTPGNPTSPINPAGHVRKRNCKKRKGAAAARKKCRKKK